MPTWTPIQSRILSVLSDGFYHKNTELLPCIDEMADTGDLRNHLLRIRKELRPLGEDIITDLTNGQTKYRHVRIVSIAE